MVEQLLQQVNWAAYNSPNGPCGPHFSVPAYTRILLRDLTPFTCQQASLPLKDQPESEFHELQQKLQLSEKEFQDKFETQYFALGPWYVMAISPRRWGMYSGDYGCMSPVKVIFNLFNLTNEVIFQTGSFSGLMSVSESELWPVGTAPLFFLVFNVFL